MYPGLLVPLGMLIPLGMLLPPDMMMPPGHSALLRMLLRQKNMNSTVSPVGHYFVTWVFFQMGVFLHLAPNFVTLLKKIFLKNKIYVS